MCHLVNMTRSDFEELAQKESDRIQKSKKTIDKTTIGIIDLDWIRV